MTQIIKVKYSEVTATPPSLQRGEVAYSEDSNALFIGTVGSAVTKIGGNVDVLKLAGIEANATADQTAGQIEAIVNHDNLLGFQADEHIDWTIDKGTTNIHPNNYNNTVYALPDSVVHDNEGGALHATDALRLSGNTLSLYKGDGSNEDITLPAVYTHPVGNVNGAFQNDDKNLTGATVIAEIKTDEGHVDLITTRTLTLDDLQVGATSSNAITLATSIDLDTLQTASHYNMYGVNNATAQHFPTTGAVGCALHVYQNYYGPVQEIVLYVNGGSVDRNNDKWIRSHTSGSWSSWVKIGSNSLTFNSNTDLDDLLPDFCANYHTNYPYNITSWATQNFPSANGGTLEIMPTYYGTLQRYTDTANVYIRHHGAGSWGAWKKQGVTNLSYLFHSPDDFDITSSTGTDVQIPINSGTQAGLMSIAHSNKLSGIEAGADVNVATNLGVTTATTTATVTSSTGNNAVIPAATTSKAGVMTNAMKSKLDGIATGAQVNVGTDLSSVYSATTININSSTGTDISLQSSTNSVAGLISAARSLKLENIETGAEVNVALASQGEAEAGSENTKTMTALRVAQAISAMANTLKNNFTATSVPNTLTDSSAGYGVGSIWMDVIGDNAYRCVDATVAAAIWVKTTLEATDLHAVATSGNTEDMTETGDNLYFTQAERTKLTGIETSADVNVATDLTIVTGTAAITLESSTGADVLLPSATTLKSGVMTSTDKIKLDGIAAGADVNVATNLTAVHNTANVVILSSTGNDAVVNEASATSSGVMSAAHHNKLDGIEAGANLGMAIGVTIDGGSF